MLIGLNVTAGYDGGIHEIIRLFFPGCRVAGTAEGADLQVNIEVVEDPEGLEVVAELRGDIETRRQRRIGPVDRVEARREIARMIYGLLKEATSQDPSPYGTLTGVRPTKLVHRYLDRGFTAGEIERELEDKFLVHPEKARLLTQVALRNRPFLLKPEETGRFVAVYIGIPYCPSRCHYCSFPGYPLRHKPGPAEFFPGLILELGRVGEALRELGFVVDCLYIGGGTPTVLDVDQWDQLLETLDRLYIGPETAEFTVEAGRPDTLNRTLLGRLRAGGVDRICVNPQTMNDDTLERIGRGHTAAMTREAFEMARQAGFGHVNMDLIIGLPGEGEAEFEQSLREVLALKPEGVTIHHLARKRGSTWDMQGGLPDRGRADRLTEAAWESLRLAGYLPYYLYRQKYMNGNQENLGFALPGTFSTYNIRVIEERQTIVGLGGGAAGKFISPGDWRLTALHHPKDPATYLNSLERLITAQVDKLRALT